MPKDGAMVLSDFPPDTLFRLKCDKCGRSGQYRHETLSQIYGPDQKMPDLLPVFSADCRKRKANVPSDRCGIVYVKDE
jgi:hypothetical protein